jgi:protein gp37
MKTRIEWATHTENFQSGCSKVSPACSNCYALTMSRRLANMGGPSRYDGVTSGTVGEPVWTGEIVADLVQLSRIFQGLRSARKPRRVFLNSMTDTFHQDAPQSALALLADEIKATSSDHPHVLMLLTKRPGGLLQWQRQHFPAGLPAWVWVGCTVEDQRRANDRIPLLMAVRAGVRFLSMEPLLGPVDLRRVSPLADGTVFDALSSPDGSPISWVITGGESGPGARPSHPDWFRSLRDQCISASVAFHFKQWGEWAGDCLCDVYSPVSCSTVARPQPGVVGVMFRCGKHRAGRVLDGRTWDGLPDV